jgi:Fe-S cluster assembly iron-binding protein IscA
MISVTEKAKERILNLRTEEGRGHEQNIRVSVQGGALTQRSSPQIKSLRIKG